MAQTHTAIHTAGAAIFDALTAEFGDCAPEVRELRGTAPGPTPGPTPEQLTNRAMSRK